MSTRGGLDRRRSGEPVARAARFLLRQGVYLVRRVAYLDWIDVMYVANLLVQTLGRRRSSAGDPR